MGSTRNCDWWFTDEAIFVDTAGRYTTQEANQDADAGAWKGFLQLLKKARPRRPINGLLVTIECRRLAPAVGRRARGAGAGRARACRSSITIWGYFSHLRARDQSDLLVGFGEFFADLGKTRVPQVWGYSLPLRVQAPRPRRDVDGLERLERRLYEQLPERLEEERDPTRRALVYRFPEQFAMLRERLVAFVDATFAPTRFEAGSAPGSLFHQRHAGRKSIDRAMGALARAGPRAQAPAPQRPSGRVTS